MTRRLTGTALLGLAVFLTGAAAAWACTNLSTLNLSQSQGQAGESVDLTGSSFATAESGGKAVQLRFDGENGALLAKAMPDKAGSIAADVKIPASAQPGYHVILATQSTKEGPAFGTPARTSFLVGSAPATVQASPSAATAAVADDGTSTGATILTVALGVLGLVLFGTGLGLFVRELRRQAVLAPERASK